MTDNFQVVLFLVLFCFCSSYQDQFSDQFSDYRFVFPVNGADTTILFNSTIQIRRFYMCLQNMYFKKCIAFISPGWFVSDIYPTHSRIVQCSQEKKSQQPPNNMEPCHQHVSPVNAKMVKIENVQDSKHLPNLSEEMPSNRVTQRYTGQCQDLFLPEDKSMLESSMGYVNQSKVINEMAAEVYHEPFKRNTLEVHSEKLDNLGLSAIDNTLLLSAIDNNLGLSAIDNTRSDYSKLHEIQKNVTNIYNTAHEQRLPMKENFEKSKSFDQDTNLKGSSSENIKYEIATTRDTILKSSSDISDIGQQDGLVKVLDQSNVAVEYATVEKHLYNNVMKNKTHVDKSDYLNLDRH
ncbi:hypothetical protein BgiBS90_028857 [Biomphalaria glabrata]|nr:hypothetical protein BgiBS90_028857 [Biomphalaria glabrata]